MKKLIIISLAAFTLILVSCNKSDQQKCEDEGKIWIAEGERCISQEQKECEEKEDMAWNAEENKCEEKSNEQAECELKGKKWEENKCVDQTEFTILLKNRKVDEDVASIATSDEGKTLLDTGKCAKVTEPQFKSLKISIGPLGNQTALCDNDDNTATISPCSAGNYEIYYDHQSVGPPNTPPIGYVLKTVDQASENCEALESLHGL